MNVCSIINLWFTRRLLGNSHVKNIKKLVAQQMFQMMMMMQDADLRAVLQRLNVDHSPPQQMVFRGFRSGRSDLSTGLFSIWLMCC